MLEVTAELALEGGWDAVQMREVAQRADVALGTLYRYFPSKEYLLVSVMIAEIEGLADRLAVKPPEGDDPVERVVDVLRRANRALQRQPQVTVAMIPRWCRATPRSHRRSPTPASSCVGSSATRSVPTAHPRAPQGSATC